MSLISDALRRREEDEGEGKQSKLSLSLSKSGVAEKKSSPATTTPDALPPEITSPALSSVEVDKTELGGQPKTSPLTLKSQQIKPEPVENSNALDEAALAAAQRPRKRKHKAWVELLLVLLALVVLVFAGVGLYVYFGRSDVTSTAVTVDTSAPPVAQPAPPSQSATPPPAVVDSAPPSPGIFTATREVLNVAEERVVEVDAVTAETDEITSVNVPVSDKSPVEAAPRIEEVILAPENEDTSTADFSAPAPAKAQVDIVAAPSPPVEELAPPPVIWPGFSLQAAMGSGTRGSVMIDGTIIKVGESMGDLRVLEITPGGVRIEYMGEKRVFRVRR
ncbi:MAG: hypothetical protein ACO398_10620 [Kiritimatiellia bacterium]